MNDINKLNLVTHDELFRIDISRAVYFQADDHYSIVYYNSDVHILLPFSLAAIEAAIKQNDEAQRCLVRLGRKYIVNTDRIIRISSTQCKLYLYDEQGKTHTVPFSKPVIRELIDANGNINALRDSRK